MHLLRLLKIPARPLIDTLFPPTCWAHPTAPAAESGLSPEARRRIAALATQNYCRHCGLTVGPYVTTSAASHCIRCDQRPTGLRHTARVGTFSEPLVTLIHRLKFARSWEIAKLLAPFLHHALIQISEETATPVDLLIPIPLHWTRRARRGFNQAEELARQTAALAINEKWKIKTPLRRIRATREQSQIDAPTRRIDNLHGAFVCRPDKHLADKHLWLIDDVSTTGATLHAAATAIRKLPKECRPASLNAAVICITDHQSPAQ
jgi:ComF family protein